MGCSLTAGLALVPPNANVLPLTKTVVICNGERMVLKCVYGVLQITAANYGRTNKGDCSGRRPVLPQNTNCNFNALAPVSQSCNGLHSCELFATTAIFTDICPDMNSYLSVTYYCLPHEIRSSAVCENANANLKCEDGSSLNINTANYGRTDSHTCSAGRPASQVAKTDCYASISKSTLAYACNGKNSCSISASNGVFSDPCVDTYKYLYTAYSCVPQSMFCLRVILSLLMGCSLSAGVTLNVAPLDADVSPRTKTKVICNGDRAVLKCEYGMLQITAADYGRANRDDCSGRRPVLPQNTNCYFNALAPVSQSCNGLRSCELFATTDIFTDPCSDMSSYLSVTYYCLPPEVRSSAVCENAIANFQCDDGSLLHIHAANYGRTDNSTCAAGRPASQIAKTDCYASNSQTLVANGCEGKNNCSISASNDVFSDPCYGTYKYLYTAYSCVPSFIGADLADLD
ncbi:rhamnose-binding lectin-like [Danio aesculapii]|uniref:rhamnose-binding lectin-like n=1 Tax=Danio aesculapii TaxID=1142201 RepID=UPI0024C09991|nr:rhamnose-binding lectin-like [Danio aesculapii]